MSAVSHQITTESATVQIGGATLLEDITVQIPAGGFTAVIGPNGSGKTTLLRSMYRAQPLTRGNIQIGDVDVWKSTARASADIRAVVPQHQGEGNEFTAAEVVAMGRYPHRRFLARQSQADRDITLDSLRTVAMESMADRPFSSLSGGERQRIIVARALAQQSGVIILDEPTNHLDARAQLAMLELLAELESTVVAALHDVNHAIAFADFVIVLGRGSLIAMGPPASVITPPLMQSVFGVEAVIATNPITGRPTIHLGRSL